ncbi:MAG: hypothetical protein ICV83_12290 [Cytophagales bacterium]|nr:hypothetical protein [Cytophagales bacterium]
MDLQAKLDTFKQLDHKEQLNNWKVLGEIANCFLFDCFANKNLAVKISNAIYGHRMLMASSKAYEGAVDIDINLCRLALEIARVGYPDRKELLPFLEDALYYSSYYPDW